jgi:hypothetical protein
MNMRIGFVSALVAVAVLAATPWMFASAGDSLPTRVDKGGQVVVEVTPVALSAGAEPWRFEVSMNTHVTPLTQDMVASAVLVDAKGRETPALRWEGDPAGGHHRRGVLLFPPPDPIPAAVTLKIRAVGGVAERTFRWELSGQ